MNVAIYDISDGRIDRRVSCPDDQVAVQPRNWEEFFLNCPDNATHIINGEPVVVPYVPTIPEQIAAIVKAVQRHLDLTAKNRNYDGILSLCSYATSTDTVFAAEGQAGVEWRDACWRTCYQGLAEVETGARAMPTPEEAVAALPPMVWP